MADLADVSTGNDSALPDINLNLGELDFTSDDIWLDEVDGHIQENLEDDIVKEALNKGVDLRQYSKEIEQDLLKVENESVQDYIKESQNISSLHKQIAACDTILERMEQMLNGFQSDLSSISTEIQSLQDQSIAMNVKLKNRQAIRGELSQYVDEMVIHEQMITAILESPVTEDDFKEQLHELNHKINFVKEQSFRDARACLDVKDILEKLKIKAIAKIREFLLQKIYAFRKPMTNYQIPQNTLLKFRIFNEFLMANERHVAKEVRDEYVETMSKIYYSYFKSYSSRLIKLQFEEAAARDDLMGVEDTAKKGFFSSKPTLKNRSTVFTLGSRGEILTAELEGPVIVPHAAAKSETRYTFESIFRSLHYALMDNCCREYLFISDFFMVSGTGAQNLFENIMGKTLTMFMVSINLFENSMGKTLTMFMVGINLFENSMGKTLTMFMVGINLFENSMGKTLTMFMKLMEDSVQDCYDSIAIFLSAHIIYRFQSIMAKREVPALERYWNTILRNLWPRFEYIVNMNIQSVRECDPNKLGQIDSRPHYITRRFAEFSAAIVGINASYPSEHVRRSLGQLQAEVENFILKMAAEFPHRKDQLIFLINNYDMMLNVLVERTTEDSKEAEMFRDLLAARTQEFVEEILAPHFGGLISWVKDSEVALERGQGDRLISEEKRVQQIVRGFNNDWKRALESINQEVMRAFTNFKNGTQILQGALTLLIQYYHRFQKVLAQPVFRNLQIRHELINIHHVMVEVKKYRPTF
ncbi:vacuolar protein sorting-associated protein 52-like protein [Plakobranchus ocellatus]|uniref:Vacuolar protein sorting-associated protein 52 homolog n=1 Tax=Plakobranchus ocellatus TaxID=259542 RepID=A0AAV4BFV4_9GAST|nr:vacuolar protein sorting-associated protein 52-like protein [Plakobranchus ocellatus]